MGKKKGAAIRARKRADAAAEALVAQQSADVESSRVQSKTDADLFVLDTSADTTALAGLRGKYRAEKKRRANDEAGLTEKEIKRRRKKRLSEKDQRIVKKLIETHTARGVARLAEQGRQRPNKKNRALRLAGNAKTNFDLWGDEDNATKKGKTVTAPVKSGPSSMAGTAPVEIITTEKASDPLDATPRLSNKLVKARTAAKLTSRPTVPVDLPHSGQSYRPDAEQHQDVIGEALSIEIRRNEAVAYKATPVGTGMSEETLAILVGDSDDGESSSDSDDDGSPEDGVDFRPKKKKQKLTRAQRNKQKRVKAERVALEERKRMKSLLNSVNDVKKYAKEIRREEADRAERKKLIAQWREEKSSEPLGVNVLGKLAETDPIRVPALPVALTSELEENNGGALRTVKPKGSLLTDRLESMTARKLAHRKNVGERKTIVQGKKRKMKGGKGREYILI